MKSLPFTLTTMAATLLLSHNTLGQSTNPLEEIIVVANRIPVPTKQVGTSVSILTKEEITARGNQSLSDIIRQLPAVSVSRNGGIGAATSLRIRGEEGFRTLWREGRRSRCEGIEADPRHGYLHTNRSQDTVHRREE